MAPVVLGTIVLVAVIVSAASRCVRGPYGVHPAIVVPGAVLAVGLACVPLLQELGGDWKQGAQWFLLIGAILAGAFSSVLHGAVLGVQILAEIGASSIRRTSSYDHPSIRALEQYDLSIGSEVEALVQSCPPPPSDAPTICDSR